MSNGLTVAIQALGADMQRIDTLSQNLTNANTPGFARQIPVSHAFDQAWNAAGDSLTAQPDLQASHTVTDRRAGTLKSTGRPLDLALVGEGYFVVATADGTAYTRRGDFHVDAAGQLVTAQGHAVQGTQGDLRLGHGTPSIASDGTIRVDGAPAGQIKRVSLPGEVELVSAGDGLLRPAGHALETDSKAEIKTGQIETSNVVPMREMVSLIESVRHFEASQKLIQGYDEALSKAIQKLGEF